MTGFWIGCAIGFLAGFDALLMLGLCGWMLWGRRDSVPLDGKPHRLTPSSNW